jgi:putative hemin transport protein
VVHEKTGTYRNVSTTGHVGLVLGEEIDLRIFYSRWKYGYWVEEDSEYQGIKTTVCSLQFFGAAGTAVHKVFQRPNSKADIFALLAKRYADDDQEPGIAVQPLDPRPIAVADHEIDALGFRAAWGAMQDTHEFFGLLKKFGVQRTQGLRLVERQFTSRVQNASARYVLREAARRGLSIMIFVGNPGCIQIHTGPVHRVELMGYWLNVMDSDFNLHLREDRIAQSWVVRKPTADGEVTSLELYDNDGETIAFIFGKRKPGIAEDNAWRALIAELGELEVEA